ncbi:Spo0B domain-containing protein [Alicyclobacillus sp. ALC3]|uniref:Spo0B domain-containing protein n=1 Tax=Alicyclobacillus sp. ALC3 TaxID=2796143 RepID=UPI00237940AE|nr:Spo0B domain-containing protein [Alicyclobacillus sp. ALC3]WDL97001.1 Spo0B domain-containing protein [Alicyclobacillus sp. ALC3]
MRRADLESAHEQGSAKDAFRIHRHDVQNFLQLVRAYLQLDRPERALTTVMDLSDWLTSLSLVQSRFEFAPSIVLWTAAQCPHVRLIRAEYTTEWRRTWSKSLCEVWTFANEQAAATGVSPLSLEMSINEVDSTLCLHIGIPSGIQSANKVLVQITAYIDRHKRTHNAKEVAIGCALDPDPLGTGSEA